MNAFKRFSQKNTMSSHTSMLSEPLLLNNHESDQSQSPEQSIQRSLPLESIRSTKSKNINLVLAYTFFTFSARSLWNQSVLSAFVYLLKSNDPKYVGFLTGLMGMTQLFASLPSGWLVDKYRRDTLLKVGSVIGCIAAISTFIASRMTSFALLGVSLAIWGLFWGVVNTSTMALFADSIADGDRSYYFMQRMLLQQCGNMFGPIMALIMFAKLGDEWTLEQCSIVICAGQVLAIPAMIMLSFMSDDYCIQEKESAAYDTHTSSHDEIEGVLECAAGDNNSGHTINSLSGEENESDIDEEYACEDASEDGSEDFELLVDTTDGSCAEEHKDFFCIPDNRAVPVLVASADVMGGLAAGMSIRYFPIFFMDNLQLTPAQVQVIFIVSMMSMAAMTRIAQWVGTKIGRVQTAVLAKWIGVFLLKAMITSQQRGMAPLYVCILYVLRTATMNSPGALTRSVLMDHVPKEERGKWSALESVNMFSWAGSAAIGGFMVDIEGILFNFQVTALFQLLATIPLMLVFKRVRREN